MKETSIGIEYHKQVDGDKKLTIRKRSSCKVQNV